MNKIYSCLTALLAVVLLVSCGGDKTYWSKIEQVPFRSAENRDWGLISPEGKVLFDDEFKECPTMAMNGRFFVETKDGYEMYTADKKPGQVGATTWKQVCPFTEDVTPAVEEGKTIVLIDRDGKTVKDMAKVGGKSVFRMFGFIDGLAVYETADHLFGAVDTEGNVVIDAQYAFVTIGDGKVVAIPKKYKTFCDRGELEKVKLVVLDTKGNQLSEFTVKGLTEISSYHQGAMAVRVKKGHPVCAGLIDEKGEWVVEPNKKVSRIGWWKGETFSYMTEEGKYGVMNFDGEVVLRAKYDFVYLLEEDVFAVYDSEEPEDDGWRLVNTDGEKIGRKTFRSVFAYGLGDTQLAFVEIEKNDYRLIDLKGEYVELDKKVNISEMKFNAAPASVETDYVDMDEIVARLNITKEGFEGLRLGMDPETVFSKACEINPALEADSLKLLTSNYLLFQQTVPEATIVHHVKFEHYLGPFYSDSISTDADIPEPTTPNSVESLSLTYLMESGTLQGKSKDLYEALVKKVRGMGRMVKSNSHAGIFQLDENHYVMVVWMENAAGIYFATGDGSQENISEYEDDADEEDDVVEAAE